jgi:DNA-directed RNA polymerase subunit M/transcription elongation factor TFIIS
MAIDLEVKHRLREIEARIKALEEKPAPVISKEILDELAKLEAQPEKPKKNMCPKCGVKPAYFFHVRSCKG